jgi:hypothetical protein
MIHREWIRLVRERSRTAMGRQCAWNGMCEALEELLPIALVEPKRNDSCVLWQLLLRRRRL